MSAPSKGAAPAPGWVRLAWCLPAALFAGLLASGGTALRSEVDWVPSLGIGLDFQLDGLSRLFLLLITGIGAMVLFYAPGYLAGDRRLPRLMALLLAFMLAMVGAVSANDLILFFVFWEATSLLSFLLVGFDRQNEASREAARQALLVTGGGGLLLLGGLVLVLQAAPGLGMSGLQAVPPEVREDPRFVAGVILVLLGAMTKSAQFPFHFWLPGAMAAPTPVSAYLHSATMVKLGVYLLARFDEAMGETLWWEVSLIGIGTATALWSALLCLRERDLKRILAWSTVSALGTLTLLIGLPNDWSALAFVAFLLAHALYKAPLFFVAGNVDHVAGTRLIDHLHGMRRALPVTATAAVLAGLSMAGLPSSFGFVAKQAISAAKELSEVVWLVGAASLAVSAVGVAVAAVAALRIFFGRPNDRLCSTAHEEGWRLEAPPLLVAATGLVLGLFPALVEPLLLDAARVISPGMVMPAEAAGDAAPRLGGVLAVVLLGTLVFWQWDRIHELLGRARHLDRFGPGRLYEGLLGLLKWAAGHFVRRLHTGHAQHYLGVVTVAAVLLMLLPLAAAWRLPPAGGPFSPADAGLAAGCVLVLVAAGLAVQARDSLARVLALGLAGLASAIVFLFRGAPDLALTQLAVEAVFVVVAAVAVTRHGAAPAVTGGRGRALVAIAFGATLAAVLLVVQASAPATALSEFFLANSVPEAFGRNVVNVIIVDFRALDTLGEIAVVLLATLAAWPLMRRLRWGRA